MDTTALIVFDHERASGSPLIERVWRSHSERGGSFIAVASTHWELVVSRVQGATSVLLHGGEVRARRVPCPADGQWHAIRFRAGVFLPLHPPGSLLNGRDLFLPVRRGRQFLLGGSWWDIPGPEDAELFVRRLAGAGLLARDPAVGHTLLQQSADASLRTLQRHMRGALGMTHALARQVERARYATQLLRTGHTISDVVADAGYFDQAHLTHSLRRLVGLTPAVISRGAHQLSFLYKTEPVRVRQTAGMPWPLPRGSIR